MYRSRVMLPQFWLGYFINHAKSAAGIALSARSLDSVYRIIYFIVAVIFL